MRRRSLLSAFLAAAAWAAILLVKPNAQYLVCAVGALLLVAGVLRRHRRGAGRLRAVLTFPVVLALALMPWLVRNRLLLGRWTLSTAFDENVARVSAVATEAALRGLEIEPWSETWEHLYDALELRAVPELADVPVKASAPCELQLDWQTQIASEARALVAANLGAYARAHVKGVVRSLMDPGHRLWYHVVTGRDWFETGAVPNVWQRMGWSLSRWAVGDALRAFWLERVWRIPPVAGALWWGLMVGRLAVMALTGRGLSRLRRSVPAVLLLVGTIAYHLVLPGPISHDRFYVPIVPVVVAVVSLGLDGISLWVPAGYNGLSAQALPLYDAAHLGGHHDRGHA